MTTLIIHEKWVGTPMKMEKKYYWELIIRMSEYKGSIKSECSYDSPEEAIEDFQKIKCCDDLLCSIHLSE